MQHDILLMWTSVAIPYINRARAFGCRAFASSTSRRRRSGTGRRLPGSRSVGTR